MTEPLHRRAAGVVVVLILVCVAGACDHSSPGGDVTAGTPADALAFAAGSGDKVVQAKSFRYSFENRDVNEFNAHCGVTMKWDGAIDTARQLAFVSLKPEAPTAVILTADALYVRSSALPGWRIKKPWLSVPWTDATNLADVDPALGVSFAPGFWAHQDATNPTTALEAMKDTVTKVDAHGHENVRGSDTTRYDLTIDPAKSGLWTGGTTTTTASTGGTVDPAQARARRQQFLEQMTQTTKPGVAAIPDDAKTAFLNGDAGPLIDFEEHSSGTTVDATGRGLLQIMAADDPQQEIRAQETATGTTIDPMIKSMVSLQASAAPTPVRSQQDRARAARQKLLDQSAKSGQLAGPLPDDVKTAFLDGNPAPFIEYEQKTTGTTIDAKSRQLLQIMAADDPQKEIRSLEASTGTTIDMFSKLTVGQLQMDDTRLRSQVGSLFNAFTSITASTWVDTTGALRRLDERVDMGGANTASTGTTAPNHPLADIRVEFWDIGAPITDQLPPPADVLAVADLPRTDIPTQLSPCNTRIPNPT